MNIDAETLTLDRWFGWGFFLGRFNFLHWRFLAEDRGSHAHSSASKAGHTRSNSSAPLPFLLLGVSLYELFAFRSRLVFLVTQWVSRFISSGVINGLVGCMRFVGCFTGSNLVLLRWRYHRRWFPFGFLHSGLWSCNWRRTKGTLSLKSSHTFLQTTTFSDTFLRIGCRHAASFGSSGML